MYIHPDFDVETRIATVRVAGTLVASIYVPNGGKDFAGKVRFLEAMAAYVAALRATGDRVVLCGDINIARTEADVHPKERDNRVVGQRADERALFERILDAGGLHDVGREQDPEQRRPVHLVGAVAQHAPAQHRLAPRLRPGERRARRADLALRFDARIRHQRSRAGGGDVRQRLVAVMIIVSDFDGTLTLDDVTTYVWDKYLPYDWRTKLLPPTYDGAVDAARDDRARLRRHPRAAQGAARRDPRQHPDAARRRGAGDLLPRPRLALRRRQPRALLLHRSVAPVVDTVHVVRRHVQRVELACRAADDDGALARGGLQEPRGGRPARAPPRPSGGLCRRRPARPAGGAHLRSNLRGRGQQPGRSGAASPGAPSRNSSSWTRSPPPCSGEIRCYHAPHGKPHRDVLDLHG